MRGKIETVVGVEIFLYLIILGYLVFSSTGCGAVLGIKEMDAWGFKAKFVTGFDVKAGANGLDTVRDFRGINTKKDEERY